MDLTRRDFIKFAGAFAAVAVGALSWDAIVNDGHPSESAPDDEQEPP